jgi:NhaP-type Na+/H+ or K+/H+ antiporter
MAEDNISTFLVFFVTLLALVLILSKYLHDAKKLSAIVPESAMVIAIGMLAGYLIHFVLRKYFSYEAVNNDDGGNDDDEQALEDDLAALLSFDPEFFFIFLLPPIIFNTGLRMGPLFFRHITPIIMFAIVGTAISAIVTALILYGFVKMGLSGGFEPTLAELLTFGALISSTDPVSTLAVFQVKRVDPRLFYLCFGESVLNDALAIVLFYSFGTFVKANQEENYEIGEALKKFMINLFTNFVGSSVLGGFGGACAALLFKQIDMRHNRLVEISVYVLLVYIPFLIAEILHLSGIVTILFTGVAANRYIVPNLSAITKVNSDMVFRLGAHLAETAIFLELGLSVFGMVGYWNWVFISCALLACLIARALNVYPLAFIFNRLLLLRDRIPSPTTGWGEQIRFGSTKYPTINTSTKAELTQELSTPTARNSSRGPGMMWGGGRKNEHGIHRMDHGATEEEGFRGDPRQQSRNGDLGHRTQSFSDQSVATEVTATPWESKDLKIRGNTTHMLWFCGLRGAVAYACVRTFPYSEDLDHRKEFAMTTMAIILITVFGLGLTTECALSWFNIDVGVDEKKYMQSYLREPIASNTLLNFERRFVKRCVIRDFDIMESIRKDVQRTHENHSSPTMVIRDRRPCVHGVEAIEITESGYLGNVEDDDLTIQKLVRTDSLFDYGGY